MLLAATGAADARCKGGQTASWYGEPQRLATGDRFRPEAETCAHRTYALGSILRVIDLDTGLGVDCAVNDRGPAVWTGCTVDLSRGSAERIRIIDKGIARASVELLEGPGGHRLRKSRRPTRR